MGVRVNADMAGCKVAFLVVEDKKYLSFQDLAAMDALKNCGAKKVISVRGFHKASDILAKIQHSPKVVMHNRFFKLTGGNVVSAFAT